MKFFKSKKFFILFILSSILLIQIIRSIYVFNFKYTFNNTKYIEAKIDKLYSKTESYISYIGKIKYSGKYVDKFIIYIKEMDEVNALSKGDIISFYSKLSESSYYNNYNEFNYKLYLNGNNIVGNIFVDNYSIIHDEITKEGYKDKFINHLEAVFDEDISNVIKAVILGEKKGLKGDVSEDFNMSGISHVLTVSGTAIYVLKRFLSKVLKKFKLKNTASFVFISLYSFFCNFSISIARAYIAYILNLFSKNLKLNFTWQEIIIICFILILIINPYYIFNYSLWYSFLAALGIKMIYPSLNSLLYNYLLKMFKEVNERNVKNKLLFKTLKYIISVFSLTISVQIMLFPIYIFSSNKFYIISLISNLVVGILVIIIYIIGFIYISVFYIPIISNIFDFFMLNLVKFLIFLTNVFSKFNGFNISFNKLGISAVIAMYILIILHRYGYIFFMNIKYRFSKRKAKLIKFVIYLVLILIIIINFVFSNFVNFVYYFNVGQGNMAIIKYGNLVIISDIGSSSAKVKPILVNFLKAYNITNIDYIFISHIHEDHINGLYDLEYEILSGNINIQNVVIAYKDEKLKEFLNRLNINVIEVSQGDELYLNKNVRAYIMSPNIEKYIKSSDGKNSNSLVYALKLKNKNILFTGDATKETEKEILKSDFVLSYFDVFQVAHHGSNTSTSGEFLNRFSFKYAVISSKKSVYGHPSDETINLLNKYKIRHYILENIGGKRMYIY